jgi:hypothetical protein
MLARGTFGTPWIIEDVYRRLSGELPLIHNYPWHETDFSAPAPIEVEQ